MIMHEKAAKGILSPKKRHEYLSQGVHMAVSIVIRGAPAIRCKHDFEDVEVKVNAPELLEKALRSKRKKCMIGTGAMSDPYLHEEQRRGLTRKCLELIEHYGFGLAIQTKSDRDIERS